MSYLDTSVLTSYYCGEERSPRVQRMLSTIRQPTVSPLVEVEFCCSVARKERAGAIERSEALRIITEFRLHVGERRYALVPIGPSEYALAADWIAGLAAPLRVLDGVHLATAFAHKLVLVTADKDLACAAKVFGVKHKLIS